MTEKRKIKPVVPLLALSFIVLFIAVMVQLRNAGISHSREILDDGWSLEYKGETRTIESIKNYNVPFELAAGDTLTLSRFINKAPFDRAFLRFKCYRAVVDVFAPELIYSYGHERIDKNLYVGSGFHYAFFEISRTKDPVRIQFVLTEPTSFSKLPQFELLPAGGAVSDYNARNLVTIIIGMFLVFVGLIAIVAGVVMAFYTPSYFSILMMGIVSLLMGFWSMCYTKTLQMFSLDLTFNSLVEYAALYLAPVAFFSLLVYMRNGWVSPWKINAVKGFAVFGALLFVVSSLAQAFGCAYYSDFLLVFHLYIFISFLFIAVLVLPYRQHGFDHSSRYLTWGVGLFGLFVFGELFRYGICEIFDIRGFVQDFSLIPFGALFFVLALFACDFVYILDGITAKAEHEVLSSMVYMDNLTGLFNRTKCEQIFGVLDRGTSNYAIVSIDMNGLSYVNDRYGHAEGDILLKAFAEVFKKAFEGLGTAIRMGGDEYVAIVRSEHMPELDSCLKRLETLEKEYAGELPVPLEAAYGVATREETMARLSKTTVTAEEVYRFADECMYAMKQSMHSEIKRM